MIEIGVIQRVHVLPKCGVNSELFTDEFTRFDGERSPIGGEACR